MRNPRRLLLVVVCLLFAPSQAAFPQAIELAGSRAPGLGGAFVAVANDSSATWWNPAGLADGPFVDLALTRNSVQRGGDQAPASRERLTSFALGTPPFGLSYYRFRVTDITPLASTASGEGDRQAIGTGVAIRSIPASQLGVTLVRTLVSGLHVGTTLKYVRSDVLTAVGTGDADALLDLGEDLEGEDSDSTFDLDVGVLAVFGAFRGGAVVRNVVEAELGGSRGVNLPRQVRLGVAFDGEAALRRPMVVSLDADVTRADGPGGERRVIAAGAEHWFYRRRLGLRAGARFNTVGAEERAFTGGASVVVRSGLFVDGHGVYGGSVDERGWGIAARVSF